MNHADDLIHWAPLLPEGMPSGLYADIGLKYPLHVCPTAVIIAPVRREALDYMALGYCRYCDALMPDAL